MREEQIVTCIKNPINKDNTPNAPEKGIEYEVLRIGQMGGYVISNITNDGKIIVWVADLFELTKPKCPAWGEGLIDLIKYGKQTNYR